MTRVELSELLGTEWSFSWGSKKVKFFFFFFQLCCISVHFVQDMICLVFAFPGLSLQASFSYKHMLVEVGTGGLDVPNQAWAIAFQRSGLIPHLTLGEWWHNAPHCLYGLFLFIFCIDEGGATWEGFCFFFWYCFLKFRREEGTAGDHRDTGGKEAGSRLPEVTTSCSQKPLQGEMAGRHGDGHLSRTKEGKGSAGLLLDDSQVPRHRTSTRGGLQPWKNGSQFCSSFPASFSEALLS